MATTTAPVVQPAEDARRRRGTTTTGARVARTVTYVALSLGALVMVFPFIWMALTSFKSLSEVNTFSWLPVSWHPENYPEAFSAAPFLTYFRNSLIVVVGQTVPTLILSSAAGYALAHLPVRGSRAILTYFIMLLVVPFQILIVPLFLVMRRMPLAGGNDILGNGGTGWVDTWPALLVPWFVSPLFIFLARQFFVSLPADLADAARVDGLSEIGIFVRIMAPLAKPAFVTIALFNIESAWNGFIWPLVVTSSVDLRPLQFGLASFAATSGGAATQWPYLMAMSTLATLPMVLLFIFGQKFFVAGVATAGIKG